MPSWMNSSVVVKGWNSCDDAVQLSVLQGGRRSLEMFDVVGLFERMDETLK